MVQIFFDLLDYDFGSGLDPNVVFAIASFVVIYGVCFMLNFFQVMMERLTAKKR